MQSTAATAPAVDSCKIVCVAWACVEVSVLWKQEEVGGRAGQAMHRQGYAEAQRKEAVKQLAPVLDQLDERRKVARLPPSNQPCFTLIGCRLAQPTWRAWCSKHVLNTKHTGRCVCCGCHGLCVAHVCIQARLDYARTHLHGTMVHMTVQCIHACMHYHVMLGLRQ